MKAHRFHQLLALTMAASFSCTDPNQDVLEKPGSGPAQRTAAEQGCTTILLGDKDGFGQGFQDGYSLYLPGGTSLPLNWRNNDPLFTDVYPADINANGSTTHQVQYTMSYTAPAQIGSAWIHLNTLGIQDGDCQVYGSDTDIRLFIDGQEIAEAFDHVDQFDFTAGRWADFAGPVDIAVPRQLLYLLQDGKVEFRWEILQKIPGMQSHDGFAIDYCELILCAGDDR